MGYLSQMKQNEPLDFLFLSQELITKIVRTMRCISSSWNFNKPQLTKNVLKMDEFLFYD